MKFIRNIRQFFRQFNQLIYKPFYYILFKSRKVGFKRFPIINGHPILKIGGKFMIGNDVKINSSIKSNPVGISNKCCIYVMKGGQLIIGNNVGISNALIYAKKSIVIEDDVLIGGGCQIYDSDFHSLEYENRMKRPDPNIKIKPVYIKKGAFIGANSIILKGVTIGQKSIIAAGSVVNKNIPDHEIWGGNPAIFIKNIPTVNV